MITITDDEQATALRSAKYALAGLQGRLATLRTGEPQEGAEAELQRNMAKVERLIFMLEKQGTKDGIWRCGCVKWHKADVVACPVCSEDNPKA